MKKRPIPQNILELFFLLSTPKVVYLLPFSFFLPHWENSFFESKKHFFYIRSKKKFLLSKESFVNSKKISLFKRNRFVYIKENGIESTKLSSIQRNFFFNRISKKLFFGCISQILWTNFFFKYHMPLKIIKLKKKKSLRWRIIN